MINQARPSRRFNLLLLSLPPSSRLDLHLLCASGDTFDDRANDIYPPAAAPILPFSIPSGHFCPSSFVVTLATSFDLNYLAYLEAQQVQPTYEQHSGADNLDPRLTAPNPPPPNDTTSASKSPHTPQQAAGMRLEEQTSKLALEDRMASSPSEPVEDQATPPATDGTSSASKPKRVRTGCLTCRERHLKCDEGTPVCLNCRKSNRPCKRGVRLNFIDTKVEDTQTLAPGADWSVNFQDESRNIAAEYKGGAGRYAVPDGDEMDLRPDEQMMLQQAPQSQMGQAHFMSHQQLPPIHSTPPDPSYESHAPSQMPEHGSETHRPPLSSGSSHSGQSIYTPPSQASHNAYATSDHTAMHPSPARDYLDSAEETLFMQVFVEEVGLWMDSMDPHKHVIYIPSPHVY